MRKLVWIVIFAALGYGAFWYLTKDRGPQYPQGVAKAFGRALLTDDTAALDGLVTGKASDDLPRLRRELAGHPGAPGTAFRITSGGGNSSSGDMTENLEIYNERGNRIMTVSAHMHKGSNGWKIDRLMITTH